MWALRNETSYAAERTWVIDKNGAKSWVVVVKATYDLLPEGQVKLAEEQEEPLFVPKYLGEDGKTSIAYEADMIPPKVGTDVLFNGQAYAPGRKPAPVVDVLLRVGSVKKRLRVFGNRHWKKNSFGIMSITSSEPFESMPVIYERAFGGWDTIPENPAEHRLYSSNPIGAGFATRGAHLNGKPLPNIEYPKNLIGSWKDRPPPAGFGAIASYWSPRLEWAGTYDEKWMNEKFPLLPNDFDQRFYQCAPDDQQAQGFLQGGELVELENLCEQGVLRFHLPKVWLVFTTLFGKRVEEHRAKLQTVILEPDLARVIMVWQTCLYCHQHAYKLDATLIREKEYEEIG